MIYILAWLIALPLSAVLAYLSLELSLGLFRLPSQRVEPDGDILFDTVILIPAHNEERIIGPTILALSGTAPQARILVVADNCTDDTARIARLGGAQVIERSDPVRRGKGFALSYGRSVLAKSPPGTVIVLDADCRLAKGAAELLVRAVQRTGGPVQGANLLQHEPGQPPLVSISNFALLVKNLVRARGLSRLGGGTLLFGTGMAFPWPLFARLPLDTANAVEDLELGLSLARDGVSISLEDRAFVTSPAAPLGASRGQRSRWEHGFLQTGLSSGLSLAGRGMIRGSRHSFTLGAHLLVPPLALLITAALAGLAIVTVLGAATANWGAFWLLAGTLAVSLAILLLVWFREGRETLSIGALLRAPFYIIWKMPIYFAFLFKRHREWNRTPRKTD